MEAAVARLESVDKMLQNVGAIQFHSRRHSVISTRIASEDDKKWIEERRYTPRQEKSMEQIVEDIGKTIKVYSLDEFNPILRKLQMQYENLRDQVELYRNQLKRYEGDEQHVVVEKKRDELLDSFREEEEVVEKEIRSCQETVQTYQSKLDSLQQEEESIRKELESMQTVISRYEQLQQRNTSLKEAIQKEKERLDNLRQTAVNELPAEETNELVKKRKELDQSEQEEAALMVELESLLKGMESSLSMSSSLVQGSEQSDLEQVMKNVDRRKSLLHQLCEQFVAAGKESGNEYALAIDLILQHGNSIPLSVLKNEMKRIIEDKSKVLPTIYGLVGDQIILIDRKTRDPTVSCLV